jgi:predicted CXXCH cytochrome family protein
MRALIVFQRRGQAGSVERKERLVDGEAVTLGRATDQVLHLKDRRVALRHARITLRAGEPVISSRAAGGIVVNDMLCREATLAPGDVIRIGANVLQVLEPPAGVDLAFSFELDAEAAAAEAAATEPYRLDLRALVMRRKSWSWLLFGATLVLTLLVPASGLLNEGLQARLRSGTLPDDGFWLSGPLSSAHHNVGKRCETCHSKPFQRVRNEACVDCHATVGRHFRAAGPVTSLDTMRCAGCHSEHNEPAMLVRRDDGLCTDCHADIRAIAGAQATSGDASDFLDGHPPFRLSLLMPIAGEGAGGRDGWAVERVPGNEPGLVERSRLKFPHDVHLDPAGIEGPDNTVVMDCDDCHEPQADGGRMRPVTMEEHCASCHRLDFDPAYPEATVPHTDATTVLRRLVEYYSRSFLELYPDPVATAAPARRAHVPGRITDPRARGRLLQQARERAFAVARDLFERRSCHDCHEISATGRADDPWKVEAARLTAEWLPSARFNHARHATTISGCDRCHAAARSDEAADVLMPAIADCRECHGSGDPHRNPAGVVESNCTMCHGFHDTRHGAWTPTVAQ